MGTGLASSPCLCCALTSSEAPGGTGPGGGGGGGGGGGCPRGVESGCSHCPPSTFPHPGALFPSVCRTAETQPPRSPFLCLDLTYVSSLLHGLGFPGDKVLKVGTPPVSPAPTHREHMPAFHTHVLPSTPPPLVFSS